MDDSFGGQQKSAAGDASQLGPILRAILQHNDQIVEQNQAILQLLNYHVQKLPKTDQVSESKASSTGHVHRLGSLRTTDEPTSRDSFVQGTPQRHGTASIRPTASQADAGPVDSTIWNAIASQHSCQSPDFARLYHEWHRPTTVREVFFGRQKWTSREFQLAFPQMFRFLSREESLHRWHAQVVVEDINSSEGASVRTAYNELRPCQSLNSTKIPVRPGYGTRPSRLARKTDDPFGAAQLWNALRGCACRRGWHDTPSITDHRTSCMRSVCVLDVSPRILICLLASTPPIDTSRLSTFIQRHLLGSNWGKVITHQFGNQINSYSFEYHIAFYVITAGSGDTKSFRKDVRGLRKSERIPSERQSTSRFLHEESLSFLQIGHYGDVSTCVQLAESYFKHDPYASRYARPGRSPLFKQILPIEPPSELFLSWISSSLRHVVCRWESAVDCIRSEAFSPRDEAVMEHANDYITHDPVSLSSRSLIWASQALKHFDHNISDTITTWKHFKRDSLAQLRDERITEASWVDNVLAIEDAIVDLGKLLKTVKHLIVAIQDLSDSLKGTSTTLQLQNSALVRDNVRLITLVIVICLPLLSLTNVFGMQFIGKTTHYAHVFFIALGPVIAATAFVIFNVKNILRLWHRLTSRMSYSIRKRMLQHRRSSWNEKGRRLEHDDTVKRDTRKSSESPSPAWTYSLFLIECVFITLPVHEVAVTFNNIRQLAGSDRRLESKTTYRDIADPRTRSIDGVMHIKIKNSQIEYHKKQRRKRKERIGGLPLALEDVMRGTPSTIVRVLGAILTAFRTLLLPVWILIILFEFAVASAFMLTLSIAGVESPKRRAFDLLGLDAIFRSKTSTMQSQVAPPNIPRTHESTTTPDDDNEPSNDQTRSHLSPPPPSQDSSTDETRSSTMLSQHSFGSHASENTIDNIEALSRSGTPPPKAAPAMNVSPSARGSGMGPLTSHRPTEREVVHDPPTHLPAGPPRTQQTSPAVVVSQATRALTASDPDYVSRPGTAQTRNTDSIDSLSAMIARVEPLTRMSAKSVTRSSDVGSYASKESLRFEETRKAQNPEPSQKSYLKVPDNTRERKSELVDYLALETPPMPPPKGAGASASRVARQ